jgi:starch synthase (maltosyl-transferring)
MNMIRKENAALHTNETLRFHTIQHDDLIWYSKATPELDNVIVVAVNLNPYETRGAWCHLPLEELGIPVDAEYQMHDLISDARYLWRGEWNYVELNPYQFPAHVFRVRRWVRSERDFDYYE